MKKTLHVSSLINNRWPISNPTCKKTVSVSVCGTGFYTSIKEKHVLKIFYRTIGICGCAPELLGHTKVPFCDKKGDTSLN